MYQLNSGVNIIDSLPPFKFAGLVPEFERIITIMIIIIIFVNITVVRR